MDNEKKIQIKPVYKIKKMEVYDKNDIDYLNGIPPLIKWWTYYYNGHFINTYHTPHKSGFDRYVDKDQFKQLRKNLKMKQKEFANFLGISTRSVTRIENGNFIGMNVLEKLSKVFGDSKWR